MDKTITVTLIDFDSRQTKELKEQTEKAANELSTNAGELLPLLLPKEKQELFKLESNRRDFNEETFSQLLYLSLIHI